MTMTANGLAKLIEECGELVQVAGKKLAYYHTDEHPDGEGSLSRRLESEIADVMAACSFVMVAMDLDATAIRTRRLTKERRFWGWHADLNNHSDAFDRASAELARITTASAASLRLADDGHEMRLPERARSTSR